MQSNLINKIAKAKRYAEEKDRITFADFTVNFKGKNNDHTISYKNGEWHCTCHFFSNWGLCSHTMALQKILDEMLPEEAFSANTAQGVVIS